MQNSVRQPISADVVRDHSWMQNEYLAHTLIIQYRGPKIRVMLNVGTEPKPIDTIDRP